MSIAWDGDSTDAQSATSFTIANLATALTYRRVLQNFRDNAPCKLKWSNLNRSHLSRFIQQDILIEDPNRTTGKSTQNVWTLTEWVTRLLDTQQASFDFTDTEISFLSKHSERITELPPEFTLTETGLNSRTIGKLRDLGLVTLEENNQHSHDSSVWQLTDRLEELLRIYDAQTAV